MINAPFNVTTFYKLMTSKKYVSKDGNIYTPINIGKKYAKRHGSFYLKKDTLDELLKILIEEHELFKKQQKNLNEKYKKLYHQDTHKNHLDINGNIINCPQCNSTHLNKKGKRTLQNKIVQRYQCQSCNRIFTIPLDDIS